MAECNHHPPADRPPPFPSLHRLLLSIREFSVREFFLVTLTSTKGVDRSVDKINTLLLWAKVPEKSLLTNEEFVLSSTAVVATLVGYYVLFGKRHRRKRKRLAEELKNAQRQVCVSFFTNGICILSLGLSLLWFYKPDIVSDKIPSINI